MRLGIIGLGRMGAGVAERLIRDGHEVVGFDPKPDARKALMAVGGEGADSLAMLVARLPPPRTLWIMLPAGEAIDGALLELFELLESGDTVIDGGNSHYRDTQRRANWLAECRIDYVDCGTSGGIRGLAHGFSLMIGGDVAVVERLRPIFASLAPRADRGWGRVGPTGAGHFTKMVHNGIEYGLMQAYAEGFSMLHHKAEFGLDPHQIAAIWRDGSVVRSWLLDLTAETLEGNPALTGIAPYIEDSGEGRWTVAEAIDLGVSAPVITLALLERLRSRDSAAYGARLLAALRNRFGGHPVHRLEGE